MIWRVVVVVICIVIVVSAVWAASNSFEVRVDGPNTFGADIIIPTPTPVSLPVNYSFRMESSQSGAPSIYVDMPLPTTHVVLMKGNRADELRRFHLCRGTLSRCTGGIQSFDADYVDWQGDGIADRLRVYFTFEDFNTLLATVDTETAHTDVVGAVSHESTFVGQTSSQDGASSTDGNTSVAPSLLVEPSIDRYSRIRLTLSGDLYAWKVAQP